MNLMFEGTMPKISKPEGYDGEVTIRNERAYVTPVQYCEDKEFEDGESTIGYYPGDCYWDGKTFRGNPEPAAFADKIVESFNKGYHSGGYPEPIPIDISHASLKVGQNALAQAYAIKFKVYKGRLVTYDAKRNQVYRSTPEKAAWVMVKIAALPNGEALLAGGQIPGISIVYETLSDDVIRLKNFGFVLDPASDFMPPLVFERHFTDKGGNVIKSTSAAGEGKTTAKLDSSSAIYQPLLIKLTEIWGEADTLKDELINAMSEEQAKALVNSWSAPAPTTQPKAAEVPTSNPVIVALAQALGLTDKQLENLVATAKTKEEPKVEPKPEVKQAVEDGETAARKALYAFKSTEEIEAIMKADGITLKTMTPDEARAAVTQKYGKNPIVSKSKATTDDVEIDFSTLTFKDALGKGFIKKID